jgi:hypothetical protein
MFNQKNIQFNVVTGYPRLQNNTWEQQVAGKKLPSSTE